MSYCFAGLVIIIVIGITQTFYLVFMIQEKIFKLSFLHQFELSQSDWSTLLPCKHFTDDVAESAGKQHNPYIHECW